MYNRYIPQRDGSYQRHQAPDREQKAQKTQQHNPPPPPPTPPIQQPVRSQAQPVGGFLRNLLPREFDTGDLIVVLLLLLMAGDCEQERDTALLTLALYFLL